MFRWISLTLAALYLCGLAVQPAAAQSTLSYELEGETIHYVVPEELCLLDPERPMERTVFDVLAQFVGADGKVFALFVGCDELELFRTDLTQVENFERIGAYYYPQEPDGTASKMSMPRARFAEILTRSVPALDVDELSSNFAEKMAEVAADPNAQMDIQQFGSTGHTDDAAYLSFISQNTTYGVQYPVVGAIAMTLVHERMIGLVMAHVTDDPAAVDAINERIRTVTEAFIDANPGSDN